MKPHQMNDEDKKAGIIKDVNDTNMSFGDIADKWGTTKSKVCGIVYRARQKKLITRPGRDNGWKIDRSGERTRKPKQRKTRDIEGGTRVRVPAMINPGDETKVSDAYRNSMVVAVTSRQPGQCHFPVGDEDEFKFCPGRALEGRPYCSGHTKVASRTIYEYRKAKHYGRRRAT